ncbi:MAG: TIGR03088 family PEP-CTERM/XrtA system glycosyltransferase [Burkholderiales bacterium]|nr:TIGR03088 family PEP-CTERM/XrtA system glycosyltransferase [Burkholderiales bacterium]
MTVARLLPDGAGVHDERPLIAHIIFRLAVGGLENGLVNLLNRLPEDRFRHAVVCLTDYTDYRHRIARKDVALYAMNKPPGHGFGTQAQMFRLLRTLKPAIVHTRNLSALEYQPVAALARVPVRIHSEHGRDANDPDGTNWKYLAIRRTVRPAVHHYVTVSADLERYLVERVHVASRSITHICNGVDTDRFHPGARGRNPIGPPGFAGEQDIVVGTVGRMDAVKDPLNLVRAFITAYEEAPDLAPRLRLAVIGDGRLRDDALRLLTAHGLADRAWLPGELREIPDALRGLDVFVCPSLSEGISNTILEAMASGLPVLATRVGGNPELVTDGVTGSFVPRSDSDAMARAIVEYGRRPELRLAHGSQARKDALTRFSLQVMVSTYTSLYQDQLAARGWTPTTASPVVSSAGGPH